MTRFIGKNPLLAAPYGQRFTAKATDLLVQQRAAEALLQEYSAYARSIGVEVVDDAMLVETEEQARLLSTWWQERTAVKSAGMTVEQVMNLKPWGDTK